MLLGLEEIRERKLGKLFLLILVYVAERQTQFGGGIEFRRNASTRYEPK